MKIVDAKGLLCPNPLIMTKKALLEKNDEEELQIIVDNENAVKNVSRYLQDHGFSLQTEKCGDIVVIHVFQKNQFPSDKNIEFRSSIQQKKKGNYIIAFQKNTLGNGPEDLGQILLKAFINTITEIDQIPDTIVFLNTGIHFALKDSPVIDSLKKLEQEGVEIFVCGTCLDYFQKIDELGVGKISNMFEILEKLSITDKVIYP